MLMRTLSGFEFETPGLDFRQQEEVGEKETRVPLKKKKVSTEGRAFRRVSVPAPICPRRNCKVLKFLLRNYYGMLEFNSACLVDCLVMLCDVVAESNISGE